MEKIKAVSLDVPDYTYVSRIYYVVMTLKYISISLKTCASKTSESSKPCSNGSYRGVVIHIAPVEPFATGIKLFDH